MARYSGIWAHLIQLFAKLPWLRAILANVGPFIPLVLVWQVAAVLEVWPRAFLPLPSQVAAAATDLTLTGSLPSQVAETTLRVVLGCAVGLTLAVAMAVLLAMLPRLWDALKDIITYLQAVGEIGWLPLLILWSGFNDRTIVIVISYTVFFPVFYGTLSGFRTIPGQLPDSVRTLGGSRWHVLREVLLPGPADDDHGIASRDGFRLANRDHGRDVGGADRPGSNPVRGTLLLSRRYHPCRYGCGRRPVVDQ